LICKQPAAVRTAGSSRRVCTIGLELDLRLIAAPETEGLPVMGRWHVVPPQGTDFVAAKAVAQE